MMLLVLLLLVGGVLGAFLGPVLPWWFLSVLGFVGAALLSRSGFKALGAGLLAGFLVWFGASVLVYFDRGLIITQRVSELFGLSSGFLLLVVSGVVGALTTGLATWCGFLARWAVLGPRATGKTT